MKSIKDILEAAKMKSADPCWKGYQMVGMKDKGGKKVPNCVPEEVQTEGAVPASEKIITVKHKTSGKTLRISANAAQKYRTMGYHYHPVNEAKDEQEYGYEGDMALNQLATLIRCGEMIKDLLKPDTDMPEWVQSKITLATDYIQTAADYLYSEMKESVEQIDEVSLKTATSAYVKRMGDDGPNEKSSIAKATKTMDYIAKKHGVRGVARAAKTVDDTYRENDPVHNPRKAFVKQIMQSVKKEEVEPIEELSNATLRGYADKARTDIQKTLPKLHTDDKAAGRIDKRVAGLAASTVAKVKNNMKKEDVEQVDEISQDLAGKYLEKVTHDQLKKSGMHHNLYGQLPPKRQAGVGRALDRLVVNKESVDNGGTVPTPAAETLTVNGQPKLSKTVGQTKMIPFVHEAKETKPPFDGPYTTTKAVIKDKSGAKHTPMSRARDLARKAMARNMKEQSNVTPNPFTVPEIDIGKAPKKSRQMNIVREAMADAKKKKKEEKVTEAGTDKFITDPELASQITKS